MGMDMDGDGAIYDDDSDGANTGVESEEGKGSEFWFKLEKIDKK